MSEVYPDEVTKLLDAAAQYVRTVPVLAQSHGSDATEAHTALVEATYLYRAGQRAPSASEDQREAVLALYKMIQCNPRLYEALDHTAFAKAADKVGLYYDRSYGLGLILKADWEAMQPYLKESS